MSVRSEVRGPVRVITIDRPEAANALDPDTSAALVEHFGEAAGDGAIGAVVLTGSGTRAFCAGMDLKAFATSGATDSPLTAFIRGTYAKPLVAAVNGPAVAGGFELVLACDLVVAADHAWFALPEVRRGLFAAGGGVFLSRRVPLAVALELGLTGEPISAPRALSLGLVNRVVAGAELLDEAVALAAAVATNAPLAVRATKELMLAAARTDGERLWALVDEARSRVFASDDAREGASAFAEGRQATWTGR
jgi:enoyl-CoA hydratase